MSGVQRGLKYEMLSLRAQYSGYRELSGHVSGPEHEMLSLRAQHDNVVGALPHHSAQRRFGVRQR